MTKLLLVLVALSVLNSAIAIQADYTQASFWGTCQDEVKAYSLWLDNCKSSRDIDAAGNLFNCPQYFAEGPTLGICERMVQYFYQSSEVQNYYLKCIIPMNRYYRSHTVDATKCQKETDECQACLNDSSCLSFRKNNLPNIQDYHNSVEPGFCVELDENCNKETQGRVAYSACKMFYGQKCLENWLHNNAQEDKCYGMQFCDPYVEVAPTSSI